MKHKGWLADTMQWGMWESPAFCWAWAVFHPSLLSSVWQGSGADRCACISGTCTDFRRFPCVRVLHVCRGTAAQQVHRDPKRHGVEIQHRDSGPPHPLSGEESSNTHTHTLSHCPQQYSFLSSGFLKSGVQTITIFQPRCLQINQNENDWWKEARCNKTEKCFIYTLTVIFEPQTHFLKVCSDQVWRP